MSTHIRDCPLDFSAITFNVFIGPPLSTIDLNRFRAQADFLRREAADIYCLQEVFSQAVVDVLRERLGSEYVLVRGSPGKARTLGRIGAQLCLGALIASVLVALLSQTSDMSALPLLLVSGAGSMWVIRQLMSSIVWSFFFGPTPGGLLMLCRKDTVRVTSHCYCSFAEQGGDWMNTFRSRGFLAACVLVHGIPVKIVNTHTNAFPTRSLQNAETVPSVERALQLDEAFGQAQGSTIAERFIVMGDFNTNPGDGEIPAARFGLKSCWTDGEPVVTIPLSKYLAKVFPETPKGLCCDYQFFRGLSIHSSEVLQDEGLSDHLPLRATYRM